MDDSSDLLNLKNRIDAITKEKNSAIARKELLKQECNKKVEELKKLGVNTDNLEQTLQQLEKERGELKQSIEHEVEGIEADLKKFKES